MLPLAKQHMAVILLLTLGGLAAADGPARLLDTLARQSKLVRNYLKNCAEHQLMLSEDDWPPGSAGVAELSLQNVFQDLGT